MWLGLKKQFNKASNTFVKRCALAFIVTIITFAILISTVLLFVVSDGVRICENGLVFKKSVPSHQPKSARLVCDLIVTKISQWSTLVIGNKKIVIAIVGVALLLLASTITMACVFALHTNQYAVEEYGEIDTPIVSDDQNKASPVIPATDVLNEGEDNESSSSLVSVYIGMAVSLGVLVVAAVLAFRQYKTFVERKKAVKIDKMRQQFEKISKEIFEEATKLYAIFGGVNENEELVVSSSGLTCAFVPTLAHLNAVHASNDRFYLPEDKNIDSIDPLDSNPGALDRREIRFDPQHGEKILHILHTIRLAQLMLLYESKGLEAFDENLKPASELYVKLGQQWPKFPQTRTYKQVELWNQGQIIVGDEDDICGQTIHDLAKGKVDPNLLDVIKERLNCIESEKVAYLRYMENMVLRQDGSTPLISQV